MLQSVQLVYVNTVCMCLVVVVVVSVPVSLQGNKESVRLLVQLKLNAAVRNEFEHFTVSIPFFHRYTAYTYVYVGR